MNLLTLHGNGGGASRFDLCRPYFEKLGVNWVAHTLPGFEGRPLGAPLSWDLLCEDLGQALDRLPRPRALLGPGIGGSLALEFLQRHADQVDLLILQSPVGPHLDRRRFPKLMKPRWIRELVKQLLAFPGLDPIWGRLLFRRSLPTDVRRRFFGEYARCEAFSSFFDLITADWFGRLRPLNIPGVLLWGAKERILSAGHVEALRPLLPFCQVRIEESFDHFPMLEQPALFCEVIWQCLCDPEADWLGPRQACQRNEESGKVSGLRRALAEGIPVPAAQLVGPSPRRIPSGGSWALRSAHPGEDAQSQSRAGQYLSLLGVEPAQFEPAAERVQQAQSHPQCLGMRMIEPKFAGVAFLEDDYEEDLVNWKEGLADQLLHGDLAGQHLDLPRLDLGGKVSSLGWQARLQELCGQIRRTFGPGRQGWDIEWADDGLTCWLLQIRPVVAASLRREWFTAANQREILPDPPSPFMVGILGNCRQRLFEYYRQFDPTLPSQRNFLEILWERPFINLSLLHGMMLRWGLPTRLVTDSIGGGSLPSLPLRPLQVLKKLPVHLRLGFSTLTSLSRFRRSCARLQELSEVDGLTLGQTAQRLEEVYVELVFGMMSLTAAASLPLALLRATSTLAEHNQYFSTATTRLVSDLEALRNLPRDSPAFHSAWQDYLARHGHRGSYESDIARPRIAEQPERWILPLLEWNRPPRRRLSWRARLTWPLAQLALPWVAAREELRSVAMRAFAQIRKRLLQSDWGESIFWLRPEEVELPFDADWLQQRKRERAEFEALELPHLLRRFDPLPQVSGQPGQGPWMGQALTSGSTQGRVWRLRQPAFELPAGYRREETVLLAPAVDPGWLPCFSLVSGVVVEVGGDLSHASLLLREMGVPALTNVAQAYADLRDGDWVRLDGATGMLKRL